MRELTMSHWHACYDSNWKGLIVDEAFAYPAKIAHGLVARIYSHAFEMGWLRPGDTVLDPFGGIGGTALYAATYGVRWIGVELEPRFHGLALQNFALWKRQMGHWPDWVEPTMLCGDSRRLGELVAEAGVIVSSPPYAEGLGHVGEDKHPERSSHNSKLRNMNQFGGYGQETPGQLGAMKEGAVEAVVSSPPYSGIRSDGKAFDGSGGFGSYSQENAKHWHTERDPANLGNLGDEENVNRETFWAASRQIVEQCHKLLRPGGHAIFVCKDYVKKGRIVPFCDNWRRLCESVGFRTVCQHRAMLVKDLGEETNLFEPPKRRTKERKSFFRRLAEKKGSPRIDYEMVICMVKEGGGGAADCVVSSPPFAESLADAPSEQVRQMHGKNMGRAVLGDGYGTTPGQLGSMKEGKAP